VSIRFQYVAVIIAAMWLAACGDRALPTSPDQFASSTPAAIDATISGTSGTATGAWSSSSSGGTVKEVLSGPAINGVVPEGLASADQSRFSSGGSTILTVQVKKVNLRDGTVLGVTLDFTPIGSITLVGGQGSLTANLGHFGVSRDQVRVKNGDAVILQGGFFQ
jgi:hypothetical protein